MRPARSGLLLTALLTLPALAQPAPLPLPDWKAWEPLLGEWKADVPTPADPTGGFTLAKELGGRVLVRHSHAEYPRTETRPASAHHDLLVLWQEGGVVRADYFDDEGHVIHYRQGEPEEKTLVLVSDPVEGQPRFRLRYRLTGAKGVAIAFELAPPGKPEAFQPYLQATAHRVR